MTYFLRGKRLLYFLFLKKSRFIIIFLIFCFSIFFGLPNLYLLSFFVFAEEIDKIGVNPLKEVLRQVGGWPVLDPYWKTTELEKTIITSMSITSRSGVPIETMPLTLENLLGKLRGDFNQMVIVDQFVDADDRNSSQNIIQFDQATLGLPSRDHFFKESASKDKEAYFELMLDIAELFGANRTYAHSEMHHVLEFETELANVSDTLD